MFECEKQRSEMEMWRGMESKVKASGGKEREGG